MKFKDLKPGTMFMADMGYGGIEYLHSVAKEVRASKGVFGDDRIDVRTSCGMDLCFDPEQTVYLYEDWAKYYVKH